MSDANPTLPNSRPSFSETLQKVLNALSMPLLAVLVAFILGGLVIWVTSGSLATVFQAYGGMVQGAFLSNAGCLKL